MRHVWDRIGPDKCVINVRNGSKNDVNIALPLPLSWYGRVGCGTHAPSQAHRDVRLI